MAERLIFCVDGGGTGSRARLMHADGAALAAAEGGPCNPTSDIDAAVESVRNLWEQAAEQVAEQAAGQAAGQAGEALRPSEHVLAMGAAGVVAPPVRQAFLAALPAFAETRLMSDGYAALIGAGAGGPCGLVILGTGAVAHRLRRDGTSLQRDGWGWIGGDRGSAAWIGRRAVRQTLEARDGLRQPTILTQWVEKALGASEAAILDWLAEAGPRRLASLAPLVSDSAAAGDALAAATLDRAAEHASGLAASLGLAQGEPLYLAGGLAEALRSRIEAQLGRSFDPLLGDALDGCWRVATDRAPPERRA